MPDNRKALNNYWCVYHWAPYISATLDEPVQKHMGAYANMAVPKHVAQQRWFRQRVYSLHLNHGITAKNAAEIAVHDWIKSYAGKPVCCILGDEFMAKILHQAINLPDLEEFRRRGS